MKQFFIVYTYVLPNGHRTRSFKILNAATATDASDAIYTSHKGVFIQVVRENNPPLATITEVRRPWR